MQQAGGDCEFMALHVPAALLTLYEYKHIKQVFANMGDVIHDIPLHDTNQRKGLQSIIVIDKTD